MQLSNTRYEVVISYEFVWFNVWFLQKGPSRNIAIINRLLYYSPNHFIIYSCFNLTCYLSSYRYSWAGSPLFITEPPSSVSQTVPCCAHCSSPRVFEFQLMPALVSLLSSADTNSGKYRCSKMYVIPTFLFIYLFIHSFIYKFIFTKKCGKNWNSKQYFISIYWFIMVSSCKILCNVQL